MAYDLITEVCEGLINVFALELSAAIDPADPVRLKTCELAPLQDDPTTRAPLVLVMYDPDLGSVPDELYGPDIGGGPRWVNYFRIVGRIPQAHDKYEALRNIGIMRDRIRRAVYKHNNMVGTEAQSGEWVWVMGPRLDFELQRQRLIGGESEWYAEVRLIFSCRSEDPPGWQ